MANPEHASRPKDHDPTAAGSRGLIETEAIIVAYAMSRLDGRFLKRLGFRSWREAFRSTGDRLGVPASSMKNLRDEFDPIHLNSRKGWHGRPLRANRQRVLGEFCGASDEAVVEVAARLLAGDKVIEELVTKPIATGRSLFENVAERLRTGRMAEAYFLANCERVCGIPSKSLIDCRDQACGFDFGVVDKNEIGIEVKGLKSVRGQILFTDHEWDQASRRKLDFWLVVVGGLDKQPRATLIKDPAASIAVTASICQISAITWRATITVPR